jgi:hypothetical protein
VVRSFAQSRARLDTHTAAGQRRGTSGNRDLHRQHGDSEAQMSEEAEACFVLPLREAAAHFACRNVRSAEAEMGGSSDDGNAHVSNDMSADLGTGFLPFFSEQGGKFL